MSGPKFLPAHVGRDTALLLAPQAVAWQLSFVLYGVYLGLLVNTVRGPLWAKFAKEVKAVNWIVLVLVTVYNGLAFADNVFWMITLARDPDTIYIGWSVDFLMPFSAALCGLVCQIFLAIRASVLINRGPVRRLFLVGMVALALTSFAGASLVVITAFLISEGKVQGFSIGYNHSVAIWLCTSAFVDIAISVTLYVTLRQRSGIVAEVDGLLERLIFVALQTAAYTAVPALVGAVVSLVYPDSSPYSLLHFAFWMILPSCYGISIFTTVSTRDMIDNYIAAANPLRLVHPAAAAPGHSNSSSSSNDVDHDHDRRYGGLVDVAVVALRDDHHGSPTHAAGGGGLERHPLAEIAPWAYPRTIALAPGPAAVRRQQRASPVGPVVARSLAPTLTSTTTRPSFGDPSRHSSGDDEEKGEPEPEPGGPEPLERISAATAAAQQAQVRIRLAEQVRDRERERADAQLREDNRRAVWW